MAIMIPKYMALPFLEVGVRVKWEGGSNLETMLHYDTNVWY